MWKTYGVISIMLKVYGLWPYKTGNAVTSSRVRTPLSLYWYCPTHPHIYERPHTYYHPNGFHVLCSYSWWILCYKPFRCDMAIHVVIFSVCANVGWDSRVVYVGCMLAVLKTKLCIHFCQTFITINTMSQSDHTVEWMDHTTWLLQFFSCTIKSAAVS
jgi:hypothetical protein